MAELILKLCSDVDVAELWAEPSTRSEKARQPNSLVDLLLQRRQNLNYKTVSFRCLENIFDKLKT